MWWVKVLLRPIMIANPFFRKGIDMAMIICYYFGIPYSIYRIPKSIKQNMSNNTDLSLLISGTNLTTPRLERALLKDQATQLLRDYIINGQIAPGTKLVERNVADMLGVSRAPARDALIELERAGLVESRSNGRHVIELDEEDICELYQVRLALEKLAVELACHKNTPQNNAVLTALFQRMKEAVREGNGQVYRESDLETHRLIWQQSGNSQLLNVLNSMVGPIFMFVTWHADKFDWDVTLDLHEDLVNQINAGDSEAAVISIERHLDNALNRSLRIIRETKPTDK